MISSPNVEMHYYFNLEKFIDTVKIVSEYEPGKKNWESILKSWSLIKKTWQFLAEI